MSLTWSTSLHQAERARNDLERELEDLQDALDEQGGATQAQVLWSDIVTSSCDDVTLWRKRWRHMVT
jgi:hypothetical protein